MSISMTAGELALRLNLSLRGDHTRRVDGAATLEDAGPLQLAFVGAAKFFEAGQRSNAGCLIAPADYPAAEGQTVIDSPQPRAHFAEALSALYPGPALQPGLHPTAVVNAGAEIHPTAIIGPYAAIGSDARIGAHTVLHPHVTVYHGVSIGERCVIHSGAVIGADGFGFEMVQGRYRKVPQVGTVLIGDDVEIGANTCIDRATLGVTKIGDGTKLDNMVHIAHNCRIGRHVVIAAQTGLAGGVEIGDYAVVGGQVGVGDRARIESKAVIGSGAGILTSKIVRAGEPVWGTPARPLHQYLAQLATLSRLSKRR
jgi:UDP-3-O-[3-hydroxymyristoyl] glucosamine N-acyltransferase